ncbi:MAG: DUF4231 domain-containing protein [Bryobacteraceae bacterium]
MIVSGFKSFPREAQYWCLGLALLSSLLSLLLLQSQRRRLFVVERSLRQQRAARRSFGLGSSQTENHETRRDRYRIETWEYIEGQRKRAAHNRRIHNTFQAAIIIGSILVTSLTSAMAGDSPFNWITIAVSILITASAGLSSYFKFRERGFSQQQTANAAEKEYNAFELRIHDYDEEIDAPKAARLFAERLEALKEEQRNRELQMEQSPERANVNGGALGAAGSAGPV